MEIQLFRETIYTYYQAHRRSFIWREEPLPYYVFVSEVMLQQTQTHRVIPKFEQFITAFPTFDALANAPLTAVLAAWQGLGYNRRALYLQKAALRIAQEFQGMLPDQPEVLETLPGIGPATARSICAFAFNKPTVFIETNVRTVFIHFFFPTHQAVHDKQLLPLVEQAVDHHNPRDWYYALMDYGVMLKRLLPNPSRKSAHYSKQSKFEGSDRQVRAAVVRWLLAHHVATHDQLLTAFVAEQTRLQGIIDGLIRDELIMSRNGVYTIDA